MRFKIFLYSFIALLAFAACGRDPFHEGGPSGGIVTEGTVRARVSMHTGDFTEVASRALTKEEEDAWDNVWVAQFRGADPETAVRIGVISEYQETSGDFEVELEAGENNIVYFITNVRTNPFLKYDGTEVSTLAEFRELRYTPDEPHNDGLTADKLVMVGEWKGKLTSSDPNINSILVYVDRIAAKINVVIKAEQAISEYFQTPSMIIDSMKLCNLPAYATFVPGGSVVGGADDVVDLVAEKFPEDPALAVKTYRSAEPYYMLENLQGVHVPAIQEEQYKNQAAEDAGIDAAATYVMIYGRMNDGRNSGPVTYKIYLGGDALKDFNIRRNHNYTLTVQIDGAGIATSDIRVDKEKVTTIELMRLNGIDRGTTRNSETRPAEASDTNWGDRTPVKPGVDKLKSQDYLYVDLGTDPEATWEFSISGNQSGWNPTVSILRPVAGWVPDGTAPEWPEEEVWEDVMPGDRLPNGARLRINLGVNIKPIPRKASLLYWNSADRSIPVKKREWYVQQMASPVFSMATYNYIPAPAGTYGVAVRATDDISWRVKSAPSGLGVVGIAGKDGVIKTGAGDYVRGHGTIVLSAGDNTKLPYRDVQAMVVSAWLGDTGTPASDDVADKTVYVLQMAPTQSFVASKTTNTKYVYDYSTDPLFETMLLVPGYAVEWAINMVDDNANYELDKRLVGASSNTDGKANTWQIYSKMDREAGLIAPSSLDAPPIFTPAGLCLMMNEDWKSIDASNFRDRLRWYLPARYQGLLDATSMMLRPTGLGSGFYGTFWTSTGPDPSSGIATDPKYSAYFAGMTVDVSGLFSPTSRVRAIRDYDLTGKDKTYPHMKMDGDGNPVIITRESDGNAVRGYDGKYTDETYRLGAPLRYFYLSATNWGFAIDGPGPATPYTGYLSTRFQVARHDAPMTPGGTDTKGTWMQASGFTSRDAVDWVQTGCAAYREGEHDDWRVPSELEMRIILLLGAGTGTSVGGSVPALQAGTDVDSFSEVSGFDFLGTTGNGSYNYWTNRNHSDATRAAYVGAGARYTYGIVGSAASKTTTGYVRCVRDLEKYAAPKE